MSKLIDFYMGTGRDHAGRSIDDVWAWRDYNLEHRHDFIQWLFPLREQSRFNRMAPTLTDEDVAEFRSSDALKHRLLRSFNLMLDFYGMAMTDLEGKVTVMRLPGRTVRGSLPHWLTKHDHNYLRMTRIMTCMDMLGMRAHAVALYECLMGIYENPALVEHGQTAAELIGEDTAAYWGAAIGRSSKKSTDSE